MKSRHQLYLDQGCQMVYFLTKNPNLGKFWKALGPRIEKAGKFWNDFTVIWYTLWPLGDVVVIWYIFPHFGILCQEKSGSTYFYISSVSHMT
jgi:hypothetical protein